MPYQLCIIEGDGIGREVIPIAVEILQALLPDLVTEHATAGWQTFLDQGASVPEATFAAIRRTKAALFGAVQSPTHKVEGYRSAILSLRQTLDLYANLRPVRAIPQLSPRKDIDMLIVRENSEGLYIGEEEAIEGGYIAKRRITVSASRRIAKAAQAAMQQQNHQRLTIVHKANVLPQSDGLFRDSVRQTINDPNITINENLIDIAAYNMLSQPQNYQTIVTTNLYGDILSDAAAHWIGGMGIAPSLNQGDEIAIAEPVHGSAPDIAGTGKANPTAAILSAALLARHHWQRPDVADQIEKAVHKAYSKHGAALIHQGTTNITNAIRTHL